MKVACDFCEKVIDKKEKECRENWRTLIFGCFEYLLCKKCSDDMFEHIEKMKKGCEEE